MVDCKLVSDILRFSMLEQELIKMNLNELRVVKIVDGPFKDHEGKISEVDEARGKAKVLVSMFGRETPIELDFLQMKKM